MNASKNKPKTCLEICSSSDLSELGRMLLDRSLEVPPHFSELNVNECFNGGGKKSPPIEENTFFFW